MLLHYILCINQYLSLHPALRLDNLEFINLKPDFDSRFPKSYLKDQVHLSITVTNIFVNFISQAIGRRKVTKQTTVTNMLFYEWVAKNHTTQHTSY